MSIPCGIVVASFMVHLGHRLPGPNHRLHWAYRARQTRAVREATFFQARAALIRTGLQPNDGQPCAVHLTLVRGHGQRLMDPDNLTACLKPVLDGLVSAGWLVGDSPKWLTSYTVEQRRDREMGPAVEVEIRRAALRRISSSENVHSR